jgi:prepilin-type N-terminal cleavage/methylation domain-containing protein
MNMLKSITDIGRNRRFTLIELIVSMAVLAVIMAVLFRLFGTAQGLWTTTTASTRVYENARVAMELIQRDFECAVASSEPGREIPFYYTGAGSMVTMVSASNLAASDAESKLCEITYSVTGTAALSGRPEHFTLYRRSVDDSTSAGGWDFYGDFSKTWASNWVATPANPPWQAVIGGVESIKINCFRADGTAFLATQPTELPAYVQIRLTLFDEQLAPAGIRTALKYTPAADNDPWERKVEQTKRTFIKVLTLGQ